MKGADSSLPFVLSVAHEARSRAVAIVNVAVDVFMFFLYSNKIGADYTDYTDKLQIADIEHL